MNKLANGVVYRGDFYPLNSQEFSLVALLYHNRGMVLTHSYLCEDLWPSDDVPSSRISSLMSQIRNKIPGLVHNEFAVGYFMLESTELTIVPGEES